MSAPLRRTQEPATDAAAQVKRDVDKVQVVFGHSIARYRVMPLLTAAGLRVPGLTVFVCFKKDTVLFKADLTCAKVKYNTPCYIGIVVFYKLKAGVAVCSCLPQLMK